MILDYKDKELLNLIQADFPLVERPFAALGNELSLAEAEVIGRIERLKNERILRMIGGVFNAACLGYKSTLVAMHVPEGRLAEAAARISLNPAVSHNYAREHHYNLWFTLTMPEKENADKAIATLAAEAGTRDYLNLPAVKLFKIDVYFDMVGDSGKQSKQPVSVCTTPLSEPERLAVKGLEQDLPLTQKPFARIAQALGIAESDLLKAAKALHEKGVMRRYGASLKHREAGFSANAMSCWKAPDDQAERVGAIMAGFSAVSHCYQRPTFGEKWPYSLFGMIHSGARQDCEEVARDISRKTGVTDYILLYSTKEFKKQRVRYFSE